MPRESDAEHLRDVALSVDGVTGMSGGILGEVGTYLPGRRVMGVRVEPTRIEVHVVLLSSAPVRRTADILAARLEAESGREVQVWVDDVEPGPAVQR